MSLLATIDALHAELDAHPDAHDTRLILADALEDAGGEWAALAEGYRALGAWRRCPKLFGASKFRFYCPGNWEGYADSLPDDWWKAADPNWDVSGEQVAALWNRSRREVEDAAALAFSRLPPDRRAELLAPP